MNSKIRSISSTSKGFREVTRKVQRTFCTCDECKFCKVRKVLKSLVYPVGFMYVTFCIKLEFLLWGQRREYSRKYHGYFLQPLPKLEEISSMCLNLITLKSVPYHKELSSTEFQPYCYFKMFCSIKHYKFIMLHITGCHIYNIIKLQNTIM